VLYTVKKSINVRSTELHVKSQPLQRNKSKNTIVIIFNLNMTFDHGIKVHKCENEYDCDLTITPLNEVKI